MKKLFATIIIAGLLASTAAYSDDVHSGLVVGWKSGIGCFVFVVHENGDYNLYGIPMSSYGQTVEANGVLSAFNNHLALKFFTGALPKVTCVIPDDEGHLVAKTVDQAYRFYQAFFSGLLP
jgi:hypothetical protein